VLEVEPSEWAELEPLVRRAMETVVGLKVPLVVDISTGSSWQRE
jgi:DNA polymerase I-like protein with 3'-5' exonuclease and polymerase domains